MNLEASGVSKNFESREPCIVCGTVGEGLVTFHHLISRGAHSEFKHCGWNQLSVCFLCHHKAHTMSLADFSIKHRNVESWLIASGWEWDEYRKKWLHPMAQNQS